MPAKYSIKDLERLSGIKAHTLRIWEQRYTILRPERTASNIRWYTADDLKRVLNISLLNRHGYKISKIACMSQDAICQAVASLLDQEQQESEQIASLVMAMVELDEARFEKIISCNVLRLGFTRMFEHILMPFIRKIGVMWQTGAINLAQEHFIYNLIRQKLITAIDGQMTPSRPDRKRFVLFFPQQEPHELLLLYYHYLLRDRGHESMYLGQSVTIDDIAAVCDVRQPDALICMITQDLKDQQLEHSLGLLKRFFPQRPIFLSGSQLAKRRGHLELPENMILFNGPDDLAQLV